MCAKLSDQWRNPIEVILSKAESDSGPLCDLDNARGDVKELSLMCDVESRHLATRCGTVTRIGKCTGVGVFICVGRRGLESSDLGEARCKLWAGCVVEWLRVSLNERGHHRGWNGGSSVYIPLHEYMYTLTAISNSV